MTDLPDRLRDLGGAVAWPEEPPGLADAVVARMAAEPVVTASSGSPRRRRAALVALLVALSGGGTLAFSGDARSALLEFLGLRSVRIERREPRPGLPTGADLGRPVASFEVGRGAVTFTPLHPPPGFASTYVDTAVPGGALSSVGRGPVVITQVGGTVEPVIGKSVGLGDRVERLVVAGRAGVYIDGDRHEFAYLDRDGSFRVETARLSGPVLLVDFPGDVLVRIEGARDRAAAVALASRLSG